MVPDALCPLALALFSFGLQAVPRNKGAVRLFFVWWGGGVEVMGRDVPVCCWCGEGQESDGGDVWCWEAWDHALWELGGARDGPCAERTSKGETEVIGMGEWERGGRWGVYGKGVRDVDEAETGLLGCEGWW